jgi:hypothetical protein
VIESYPGAAQDLLGIPRKGTSLDELRWGLQRLGAVGKFMSPKVSHDEVDAITSAIVGLYYLAGEHFSLGNAAEDYLIVPRPTTMNYSILSAILRASGLDAVSEPSAPERPLKSVRSGKRRVRPAGQKASRRRRGASSSAMAAT